MKTINELWDLFLAVSGLLAVIAVGAFCIGLGWGLFTRALHFGMSLV